MPIKYIVCGHNMTKCGKDQGGRNTFSDSEGLVRAEYLAINSQSFPCSHHACLAGLINKQLIVLYDITCESSRSTFIVICYLDIF